MISNWQTFSTDPAQNAALYAAALYNFFIKTETYSHTTPDYMAYLDSRGFLSIGVGFNLTVSNVKAAVFSELGLVQNDPKLSSPSLANLNVVENGYIQSLINAIKNKDANLFNATLATRAANTALTAVLGYLPSVLDDTLAKKIFDSIIGTYEGVVNTWLAGVPLSKERTALVSLAYNSKVGANGLPTTLGTGLKTAIQNGNHAEAWFEIRYHTNKDSLSAIPPTDAAGIAKRRYYEAEVFGLYSGSTDYAQQLKEVKDAYRTLQLHRSDILKYEGLYGVNPDNTNGVRNMIAAANNDFGAGAVRTLVASFDPAKPLILADLLVQNPGNTKLQNALAADMDADQTNDRFLSTDIYLDSNTGTAYCSVLDASKDYKGRANISNSILIGGVGDNYLVAGDGNDILIGGDGTDRLEGGTGDDLLMGGAGDDVYIIDSGDGSDTIEDKLGVNHIILDGKALGDFYTTDGGSTYISYDGDFTATLVSGDLLVNDSSGTRLTLNQDFQSGDFGITLKNAPTDPTIPQTTNDIIGDPLIHTATIAPGSEGADWVVIKTYDFLYDDQSHLISYSADYYLVDANRNPTEGGQQARDDTLLHDTAGNDHFMSGDGKDTITLNMGGDDIVDTGAGDDTVTITKGGNDVINLGAGDDNLITYYSVTGNLTVNGGDGRDYLGAGSGRDLIEGGAGSDFLYGSSENDRLYGDAQIDTATAIGQGETQQGGGQQGELADAEDGNDLVITGEGNDFIAGGAGDDLIITGAGDDYIEGDLNISTQGDQWKNWAVTETSSSTGYSYSFQNIYTESDEGVGDDTIYAGAGDDVAFGQRGNDTLYMGAGNDKAWGHEGSDILIGGAGDDMLNGDNGIAFLAESLHGSDYIDGGDGNDNLFGEGGSDTIFGGDGNDSLFGDADNISVTYQGNDYLDGEAGDDELQGFGGDDELFGGDGADLMLGDDGNDYLDGEAGNDTIYGGNGNDRPGKSIPDSFHVGNTPTLQTHFILEEAVFRSVIVPLLQSY